MVPFVPGSFYAKKPKTVEFKMPATPQKSVPARNKSLGTGTGRGGGKARDNKENIARKSTGDKSRSSTRGRSRGRPRGAGGNLPVQRIREESSDSEGDRLQRHFMQQFDSNEEASGSEGGQQVAEIDEEVDEEGPDEDLDDYEWKCKLLEYIQQYPDVFDLASPRYKNKHLREQAWEEIAIGMESDVKTVKDAWRHIRDTYRKKQLKVTAGGAGGSGGSGGRKKSGSAGESRKEVADRWRFYAQMSFYKPFIYSRLTTSNIKRKHTVIEAEATQNENSLSASTSTSSVRELVDTVKPVAKQTKRYKEQSKLETKLIEYLDREQQAVQPEPTTQARSNDLIDLHLATVSAMIRQRLNSEQQNDLLPKLFNFVNQSITQYEAGRQGFAGVAVPVGNVAGPMMQELNSPMMQPREQQQNNPYMYDFTQL